LRGYPAAFCFCKRGAQKILKYFKKLQYAHLVVASVGNVEKVFLSLKRGGSSFCFHNDHFPFVNGYETPQTLGIDRMVLAAGQLYSFRAE
jgi:type III pantothenate kinase